MNSYTIISFDQTKDAATIEAAEDRSLNLWLRRKRVRSEIYRLALNPDDNQVEYLTEILAAGPQRPLIFLMRDPAAAVDQVHAIKRLATAGTAAEIVYFGPADALPSVPTDIPVQIVPAETSDAILALAEEFAAR